MNEPVIRVQDLSRRFGKNQALENVNLEVRPGIVLGLLAFAPFCMVSAWWFFLRYDAAENPTMWTDVTWSEWTTLLLVSAAGLWGSYHAARLQRSGNGPTMTRLVGRIFGGRWWANRPETLSFANFQSALSWREWHERGRAIPWLFASAVFVFGCLCWALSPDTREVFDMGSGLSMMAAISFWLWGFYLGMRSKTQRFSNFDATRPITDAQWSRALLRNTAKSTLTACGVWVLGMGLVGAVVWTIEDESLVSTLRLSLGGEFASHIPRHELDLLLSGTVILTVSLWGLACWTLSAIGMMLALLRRRATIIVVPGSFGLFILAVLFTKILVPHKSQRLAGLNLWGTFLVTLIVITLASFVVAWRRKLVSLSTCVASLVAWLALTSCIIIWIVSSTPPDAKTLFVCFTSSSLLLLPFLPLAATPLAVAWNRHR